MPKKVSVAYKYDKPIRRLICNYARILHNLNKQQLAEILRADCECSSSDYIYQPHRHVVTGDLHIIPSQHLRVLFSKGARFRNPKVICWNDVRNAGSEAFKSQFFVHSSLESIRSQNRFWAKHMQL